MLVEVFCSNVARRHLSVYLHLLALDENLAFLGHPERSCKSCLRRLKSLQVMLCSTSIAWFLPHALSEKKNYFFFNWRVPLCLHQLGKASGKLGSSFKSFSLATSPQKAPNLLSTTHFFHPRDNFERLFKSCNASLFP